MAILESDHDSSDYEDDCSDDCSGASLLVGCSFEQFLFSFACVCGTSLVVCCATLSMFICAMQFGLNT